MMVLQGGVIIITPLHLLLIERGLTDIAQIELLSLQLEMFSKHVEVLITTLVLLGEKWLWHLLTGLRVRA